MAAVAQLVERWFVVPVVAGSNPVGRPRLRTVKCFVWQAIKFYVRIIITTSQGSPRLWS